MSRMQQDQHNTMSAHCASIRDVLLGLIRSADDPLWAVLDAFEAAEALFERQIGYDAAGAYIARKQDQGRHCLVVEEDAEALAVQESAATPPPVTGQVAEAGAPSGAPTQTSLSSEDRLLALVRKATTAPSTRDLMRELDLSDSRIYQLVKRLTGAGLVRREYTAEGTMVFVPEVPALNGAAKA